MYVYLYALIHLSPDCSLVFVTNELIDKPPNFFAQYVYELSSIVKFSFMQNPGA